MSPNDEKNQEVTLRQMRTAISVFYQLASQIEDQRFVGLIRILSRYVDRAENMHRIGVDFRTAEIDLEEHEVAYLASNFRDTFGNTLKSPTSWSIFQDIVHAA